MENKQHLSEERYQKNKNKITKLAIIVLIIGILIGGSLIATGLIKQSKVNSEYSEESKSNLQEKIETEKNFLETKKEELEIKGIKYDTFASYDDGQVYDLYIITNVLNPSFDFCVFDEYKNNTLTSKYCAYIQQLDELTDSNKDFDSFDNIPFYMFGAFAIIASCMIAGSLYMVTKRREIIAFTTQQVMPVAKEGIDAMAPTIGNVAKEISKGIKAGTKDDKE